MFLIFIMIIVSVDVTLGFSISRCNLMDKSNCTISIFQRLQNTDITEQMISQTLEDIQVCND